MKHPLPLKAARLLLLTLLCCAGLAAHADVVTGRAVDAESGEPLAEARLNYLILPVSNQGVIFLKKTEVDSAGRFAIPVEFLAKLTIEITYFGYNKFQKEYHVAGGKDTIDVGDIGLTLSDVLLGEAEVKARAKRFTMRGDTVVFNPEAFHLEEGERMATLLTQLPGVSISDGKLFFMDKQVHLKMNGRDVTDDKLIGLLPAEAVQNVKSYEQKSQVTELTGMDDGQRRQVLDIVIKPGFMDKWYGQTKASAYASENYRASANLHYLTDRDPFNVYVRASDSETRTWGVSGDSEYDWGSPEPRRQQFGSLSYKHSWRPEGVKTSFNEDYWNLGFSPDHNDISQNSWQNRQTFADVTQPVFSSQHAYNYSHSLDLPLQASLTMHLDPRSWLRVEARGGVTKGDKRSRTEEETYHADRFADADRTMVNASTTKTWKHSDSREVRGVIQYNRVFNGGDMAISIDPQWRREKGNMTQQRTYDYFDLGTHDDMQQTELSESEYRQFKVDAIVNYQIIPKRLQSSAGYMMSYSHTTDNSLATRNSLIDDANSFDRSQKVLNCQPYLALSTSLGNLWMGARLEMQNRDERFAYNRGRLDTLINRNTWLPRPSFNLRWTATKRSEMVLRGSWGRIPADLLESSAYTDDTDPLHIKMGNPNLRSLRAFDGETTYSLMIPKGQQLLSAGINYGTTTRPVIPVQAYNPTTGGYVTTTGNAGRSSLTSLRLSYERMLGIFRLVSRTNGSTRSTYNFQTLRSIDDPWLQFGIDDKKAQQELVLSLNTERWEASAYASAAYRSLRYDDPTMANQYLWDYQGELMGKYKLPHWTFFLQARLTGAEGYLSDMANRKRLALNASITWKTLHGKGQLMLMARDILNQMKTVFSNIQPYERTDYRHETMHRYLCLTFTYNFDAKAKTKTKGGQ